MGFIWGSNSVAVLSCDFDIKRVKRHVNNSQNTAIRLSHKTFFIFYETIFTDSFPL